MFDGIMLSEPTTWANDGNPGSGKRSVCLLNSFSAQTPQSDRSAVGEKNRVALGVWCGVWTRQLASGTADRQDGRRAVSMADNPSSAMATELGRPRGVVDGALMLPR